MAKLRHMLLADDFRSRLDNKFDMHGVFNHLILDALPMKYPQMCIAGILNTDPGEERGVIAVELVDHHGFALGRTEEQFAGHPLTKISWGDHRTGVFPFIIRIPNVPLQEPGIHTFRVLQDGHLVGAVRFLVEQSPGMGSQPR